MVIIINDMLWFSLLFVFFWNVFICLYSKVDGFVAYLNLQLDWGQYGLGFIK